MVLAEKTVEAAQALARSYEDSIKAAQAQVQAVKDLEQYVRIKAPFAGMITERNVHTIVRRGTDELREGTKVTAQAAKAS